jgi:hypothetical protein
VTEVVNLEALGGSRFGSHEALSSGFEAPNGGQSGFVVSRDAGSSSFHALSVFAALASLGDSASSAFRGVVASSALVGALLSRSQGALSNTARVPGATLFSLQAASVVLAALVAFGAFDLSASFDGLGALSVAARVSGAASELGGVSCSSALVALLLVVFDVALVCGAVCLFAFDGLDALSLAARVPEATVAELLGVSCSSALVAFTGIV